jgi:tetratricopeptide (TPR) repeat protein/energy-coupling factor transporter ATP-binding protein EcfA2
MSYPEREALIHWLSLVLPPHLGSNPSLLAEEIIRAQQTNIPITQPDHALALQTLEAQNSLYIAGDQYNLSGDFRNATITIGGYHIVVQYQPPTPTLSSSISPDEQVALGYPPLVRRFVVGRTSELRLLARRFFDERSNITVVTGMGGIGKTTLATMFARMLIEEHHVVRERLLWCSLNSNDSLQGFWKALSDVVGDRESNVAILVDPAKSYTVKLETAAALLDTYADAVFVDDLHKPLMQDLVALLTVELPARCQQTRFVLISRRRPTLTGTVLPPEELGGLDQAAAHALFMASIPDTAQIDRQNLVALISRCGGHPLALRVVAGRLTKRTIEELLASFPIWDNDLRLLMEGVFNDLSLQQRELAYGMAVLRTSVNMAFLTRLVQKFSPQLVDRLVLELQDFHVIEPELRQALDQRHSQVTLFGMHDLIRDYCRLVQSETLQLRHSTAYITWNALLPAHIQAIITEAQAVQWPFLPEVDRGNKVEVLFLEPNSELPVLRNLDIMLEALHHSLAIDSDASSAALLFTVDRFLYRWGMIPQLMEYLDHLDRRHVALAPQLRFRKARILKDWEQFQNALDQLASFTPYELARLDTMQELPRVLAVIDQIKGEIYAATGEYQLAIDFYRSSVQYYERMTVPEGKGLSSSYALLGDVYAATGDSAMAESYYLQSYELCIAERSLFYAARSQMKLGFLALASNDPDRALAHLGESRRLMEASVANRLAALSNSLDYARVLWGIARLLSNRAQHNEASKLAALAYNVFRAQQLPKLAQEVAQFLEALGDIIEH